MTYPRGKGKSLTCLEYRLKLANGQRGYKQASQWKEWALKQESAHPGLTMNCKTQSATERPLKAVRRGADHCYLQPVKTQGTKLESGAFNLGLVFIILTWNSWLFSLVCQCSRGATSKSEILLWAGLAPVNNWNRCDLPDIVKISKTLQWKSSAKLEENNFSCCLFLCCEYHEERMGQWKPAYRKENIFSFFSFGYFLRLLWVKLFCVEIAF